MLGFGPDDEVIGGISDRRVRRLLDVCGNRVAFKEEIYREMATDAKEIIHVNLLQIREVRKARKEAEVMAINTMYKRKAAKVQPVDDQPSDGTTPEGDPYWREKRWDAVKG